MKQINLFKPESKSYGGTLLRTRKGRSCGRPLSTQYTMHLVLRSSKAVGEWSFKRRHNEKKIREIITKFAVKYGVRIISLANVGNHLHFHVKFYNRNTYKPFIRALTAAIAMAITGVSRWNRLKKGNAHEDRATKKRDRLKFWDYRPFTRVIIGLRNFLGLEDYISINKLEGSGAPRQVARMMISGRKELEFLRIRAIGIK